MDSERDNKDIILIDRLRKFYEPIEMYWGDNEAVTLCDIYKAIENKQCEVVEPYGDTWKHICDDDKSRDWHIGRVIYYINNPDEIRDIEIDNLYMDDYIFPVPQILDGNHRFLAGVYMNEQGKMKSMPCKYSGREDVLEYLNGSTDEIPVE